MNNLITANELTMSSFDIWKKLNDFRGEVGGSKIQHGDFLVRVEDELDDLGVSESFVHPQNKQNVRFYNLNKDQILLVGMRESKVVRKKVLFWIKSLTSNQDQRKLPNNFIEALKCLVESEEKLLLAAPKIAFVDNLVERSTLMTATQVGAKHKMSAVKLNRFLDELGGVYNKSVKRSRVFTQSFIDKGYGELKQTEQGHSQALITASGEVWINEQLINEGAI